MELGDGTKASHRPTRLRVNEQSAHDIAQLQRHRLPHSFLLALVWHPTRGTESMILFVSPHDAW